MTVKEYLLSINPTSKGILVLFAMILLLPLLLDIIMLLFCGMEVKGFSITLFFISGYAKITVGLLLYHIICFFAINFYKSFF